MLDRSGVKNMHNDTGLIQNGWQEAELRPVFGWVVAMWLCCSLIYWEPLLTQGLGSNLYTPFRPQRTRRKV